MQKTAATVTNIKLLGADPEFFSCGISINTIEILLRDAVAGGDSDMESLCRVALYARASAGNLAAEKIAQLLFGAA